MQNQKKTGLILILFALGIFMGAIDSGIVSPAREIIQKSFDVTPNAGVWMLTIYTLAYAVAMPITGKMADRYGYKRLYVFSIVLFGLGSLLAGLSDFYGTFGFFLAARVIQAIGGGGIMPIATTVIGKSFPEDKRGMALGLVGGIYGIATILGPTLGSTILNVAGTDGWGWLFFINVPISIAILLLSRILLNETSEVRGRLDIAGSLLVGGVVASLMYALTNLDFFHVSDSIRTSKVWPFLLVFLVLLPVLILTERRASDPVLSPRYFTSKQMLITFLLAFVVGVGMMGMVFVPQFAENVLKLKSGDGGFMVTLLAVFSGVAAPLSGRLIDKRGARLVLQLGFLFTIAGTLYLGIVAVQHMQFVHVLIGLAFMGLGVGFSIGAPLNYIVMHSVPADETATALATMSLMRSVGVTISPSIMIGFIVQAGKETGPALMKLTASGMPQGGGGQMPADTLTALQTADVTTITDILKKSISAMVPNAQAREGVAAGIEKMRSAIESTFQSTMNTGYAHMFTAAAVIAATGLFISLFLQEKQKSA